MCLFQLVYLVWYSWTRASLRYLLKKQSCSFQVIKEAGNQTKADNDKTSTLYHKIQSHIILDDYPGLVTSLVSWIDEGKVDDHLLRLMAHLVLVHRGLGIGSSREDEERILVEYTRYLMREDRLPVIPWYVSRISSELQLPLYSRFLAG